MQTNKLDADYLVRHSKNAWAAITVFDSIDSTSSWLKTQNNCPVICLAEQQTNGRGRNGNHWRSPNAENIYLSFNWSFQSLPQHLPLLSLWLGMAVAKAIETLGVEGHGIKWPNDLYWQHKKMGGILIETSNASSQVIVGLGINTNVSMMRGVDQPWTSLSEIIGHHVDRNAFLITLLDVLYKAMESFAELEVGSLQARWSQWDLLKDKSVSFLQNGESCEGVAKGIDSSGYLLVTLASGKTKAFNTSISKVRW
ncbi:MAG: biotin--[acetyl-CoA-carboxylase] ligase [Leucothrix sp.]